jgi:hypothetical protein
MQLPAPAPRRVAVLQSNYIPWKGYFDIIQQVDLFVFYDDVQYTKQDWRDRNRIKTERGLEWLTIPIERRRGQLICEVKFQDGAWAARHWERIVSLYSRAPHFAYYRPLLEEIYLHRRWESLSELNQHLIRTLSRECLGIRTEFRDSREFALQGSKLPRLLDLLTRLSTTTYLSGPAARAYLDPAATEAAGIQVEWMDYSGYPEYPQFHPPFAHNVTVLDLLFHTGPAAPSFIWGWRAAAAAARPPQR